ncbi:hypothetical protein D3C72_1830900 [compost metagenome]
MKLTEERTVKRTLLLGISLLFLLTGCSRLVNMLYGEKPLTITPTPTTIQPSTPRIGEKVVVTMQREFQGTYMLYLVDINEDHDRSGVLIDTLQVPGGALTFSVDLKGEYTDNRGRSITLVPGKTYCFVVEDSATKASWSEPFTLRE